MAIRAVNYPDYRVARERMVREQVFGKGIVDRRVLKALLQVPRHLFLGHKAGPEAYTDHALPIGFSQTMSQPYMVAYLSEQLALQGDEEVLEIGTGSGYQAAVLATLAKTVYTIERIPELAHRASSVFRELGLKHMFTKTADGACGWPEMAPFDRILLTAAASEVPQNLVIQLRDGGFLLGPVVRDDGGQEIVKLARRGESFTLERLKPCSFVPLVRLDRVPSSSDLNNANI
ncbi:MAG: protein-L-isoaspartate(D-aspartate) O-methyltransferase [Candidatus Krumholzibacteria bacterium]|nr:protein-L-isoaspartate(D-aspartate) O-methyltransferase [Candidatus Krumholzibacteria bacterium]